MPVDPRHLTDLLDLIRSALDALADADLAADAAARELVAQGAHPATVGGMYRVRDHVRKSYGLAGAATGALASTRIAYAAQYAATGVALPTEGERTGGAYLDRPAPV